MQEQQGDPDFHDRPDRRKLHRSCGLVGISEAELDHMTTENASRRTLWTFHATPLGIRSRCLRFARPLKETIQYRSIFALLLPTFALS